MDASAADRANATAKCLGSHQPSRFLGYSTHPSGHDRYQCASCSFVFTMLPDPVANVVAPWHRAVR
jgi:transposase-like protein